LSAIPTQTIEGPLAAVREAEVRLLNEIAATLAEMGDPTSEDRARLLDVAKDLQAMFFLVVVIGEFNAGKSSFVNAMLGDALLPTGITPTTEMIELIRYGATISRIPTVREDGIREWTHPNTGAPGVAIVDTPGTGSVFQKHETTAKSFLHRSDLVIFLLSAKRALAETERLYLDMAKQYGKKIILVVNQVDLLGPAEQVEVRRFVERQLQDLLDMRPLIFMVSAKEALASAAVRAGAVKSGSAVIGEAAPTLVGGGIDAVRAHLRGVLTEAPPAQQKLLAQLDMAQQVVRRRQESVKGNADLVSVDTAKVLEVQQELEQQALGLDIQLREARAEIDRVFEGIRQRGLSFINENLSVRKIGRSRDREALQVEFQDVVLGRALRDINEATSGYINAVIDQSRLYWRGIIARLNQLADLMEQELSGLDASVYAEQRETLQEAIRIAEAELKSYSSGRVVGEIQAMFESNMSGLTTSALATVSGLVLAIIALATHGPLIGVGAAPLALPAFIVGAPLALGGSVYAWRYLRRVSEDTKREFNIRVDQLEATYHQALNDLTQKERSRLTQYGKQVLTPFFSRLDVLAERYAAQQTALQKHIDDIEGLRGQIKQLK
jgi:small GTP-binding protein